MERVPIAVVFVAAGILIGLYQSYKLKRREESLTEIIRMLEEISVFIRYKVLPVEHLILEMKERFRFIDLVNQKLTERLNNYSQKSYNWRIAWSECAEEYPALKKEDRELLISFGKQLGNSDVAGQLSLLELNKVMFGTKLTEAIEENSKKGKMYRSVGLLTGLGIATIIL